MSAVNWSEGSIARAVALQTLARKCVVLADRCNWTGHECDVLLLRQGGWPQPPVIVNCIRRATPAKDAYKLTPAQVMDIARLANLRMWEAYHQRDAARDDAKRMRDAIKDAA